MRINTQKHFDTETARAIMERIVSPLVASLTIAVSNTTDTSLDELGLPVVWTPVINDDNEISVIPSLIVASPDGEHILVDSTTTDPMNISDVHYIFTEKEEAEDFIDEYISSKQPTFIGITVIVM